ncbi:MAG: hypothetical protein WAK04_17190 [Xanthobacteraceae bacterium]
MPEPFTVASLRAVLQGVLSRRQQMPGDAEIERLVGVLNYWQSHYASIAHDQDELLRQEETALETLAVVLPRLKAKTQAELDFLRAVKWGGNIVAAKEKRLHEIEALLQSVLIAMRAKFWNRFWGQRNTVENNKKWHELQEALCRDFIAAMRPTNPHETFGLSEKGVLARFIAAVMPSITGETVKSSSVGQHRKKAARKKNHAVA